MAPHALETRYTVPMLRSVVLAVLLAVSPAALGDEERKAFRVVLDGSFAEFVMACEIVDDGTRRRLRYREYLPQTDRFAAEVLSCTVTVLDFRGRISAELYADGKPVARVRQNAVRPVVSVRSDGPWGAARGRRSAIPVSPESLPPPERSSRRQ